MSALVLMKHHGSQDLRHADVVGFIRPVQNPVNSIGAFPFFEPRGPGPFLILELINQTANHSGVLAKQKQVFGCGVFPKGMVRSEFGKGGILFLLAHRTIQKAAV